MKTIVLAATFAVGSIATTQSVNAETVEVVGHNTNAECVYADSEFSGRWQIEPDKLSKDGRSWHLKNNRATIRWNYFGHGVVVDATVSASTSDAARGTDRPATAAPAVDQDATNAELRRRLDALEGRPARPRLSLTTAWGCRWSSQ